WRAWTLMTEGIAFSKFSMSPDEKHCPNCGKPNLCGMDAAVECWCVREMVPQALIELLPERGKSCICIHCMRDFKSGVTDEIVAGR
ncbi:MAG TPA: cysteine-rich CWC family protein, partial [Luteolibacter sp.]